MADERLCPAWLCEKIEWRARSIGGICLPQLCQEFSGGESMTPLGMTCRVAQTLDQALGLCPECADKCGQGPKAWEKQLNKYNAAPANKGRADVAGKDARPQGSGGPTDGNDAAAMRPRTGALPPLSDEERRRRFPVTPLSTIDWHDDWAGSTFPADWA